MRRLHNRNSEVKQNVDSFLRAYPRELLTKTEEQRIASLPFDHTDRWKLVQHNMRFAVQVCLYYYNKNFLVRDFDALLSVAVEALQYVALKKFKQMGDTGADFIGYAKWYLRRDLLREVHRQLCVVKLPEYRPSNRDRLREDCYYQIHLGTIDGGEAFEHANVHAQEYPSIVLRDPGVEVGEENDPEVRRQKLISEVNRLIKKPWDLRILRMYYALDGGEPMSLAEVARDLQEQFPGTKLPTSEEGIRQILKRCKKRLAKSKILKELVS